MYPAPRHPDHLIHQLRQDLEGWTPASIADQLGPSAENALQRNQAIPGRIKLAGDSGSQATLTRLYLLGETLPAEPIEAAHPHLGLAGALQLGILRENRAGYCATIRLQPHEKWWVASDIGEPENPEHVVGIGSATHVLLRHTIRTPIKTALDMGTGCGIQALHLSEHAEHVIATDISERACAYARFNVALNELTNVTVLKGSLFEPVKGQSFDLIITNPPFVITPQVLRDRGQLEYRDGGMERDNLVAHIARKAPAHLRPGGTLQMLGNWEQHANQDHWADRIQGWLEAALPTISPDGLRAWVVQRDSVDAPQYAEMWLRDAGKHHQWEDDYLAWVTDFARANIDRIGMGLIVLQRASEVEGLMMVAEEISVGQVPDGAAAARALRHLQIEETWSDRHYNKHPALWEQRLHRPGETDVHGIRLLLDDHDISVSAETAAFVGASDGELSARQIVVALSALMGVEAEDVADQIQSELSGLLRNGMLDVVRH